MDNQTARSKRSEGIFKSGRVRAGINPEPGNQGMFIGDLADVRELFGSFRGTFSGVGMTAYSRIVPAYFHQPFHIVALRKTRDLPLLRNCATVFCLEEETGLVAEQGVNSAHLLAHSLTREFLRKSPNPKYLLLYQSYPDLEELAAHEGWVILANPAYLRARVAERAFFQEMMGSLQLRGIPGDIYPLEAIWSHGYDYWAQRIDPRFVIQFPEIHQGGGKGTYYVKTAFDFERLQDILKGGTWRGIKPKIAFVRKYIEGIPVSLSLCVTRHGILFSGLQRQLIDLPFCPDVLGNGIFCGHAWGETAWPSRIHDEAVSQARSIAGELSRLGFRGILGIDFMITRDRKHIYPIECNPRFTGAFPMLSQLHLQKDLIPMDVFHILEFLDLPYDMDVGALNSRYAEPLRGSHVILYGPPNNLREQGKSLKAGLYELDPKEESVRFLGGAWDYRDIGSERQFVLIDGPPDREEEAVGLPDPLYRLCRVLFPFPIIDEENNLSPHAVRVVARVYEGLFR